MSSVLSNRQVVTAFLEIASGDLEGVINILTGIDGGQLDSKEGEGELQTLLAVPGVETREEPEHGSAEYSRLVEVYRKADKR